jgi:hypothetical protein
METPAPRFIRCWVLACSLLATLVGGFNALVDPYLLFGSPRIQGFNERKPGVETQERLMKAYQVTRAAPHALLLGTSRVDLGLDTRHSVWPASARPAYNLGIAAADPYTSLRYLQHVSATGKPDLVILGLDFEYFLSSGSGEHSNALDFESRLSVDRNGAVNGGQRLQHARDLFQGLLSLDALLDSIDTLNANRRPDSADLAPSGDLSEAGLRSDAVELGSSSLFAQRDLRNIRFYYGKTKSNEGMADIQGIIDLCRQRGTRLILFINPVHADMLETFDLLGLWPAYESWKRDLVAMLAQQPGSTGAIALWDFSGYDSYTTESVPNASRDVLHWFWEPSHYTKELGDKIIERLFGGGDGTYGVLLTPATIESRIADVRAAREAYRNSQPADVGRVREIFATSVGLKGPTTASLQ